MVETINQAALSRAVSEHSPLRLDQVERLFGGVTPENKATAWRFLKMIPRHQMEVEMACARIRPGIPEVVVEAVR